jgi:hypothetical protein
MFAHGRPLLECRAVVREVHLAWRKLAEETAAATSENYRRILNQILSSERIYARRNNLRSPKGTRKAEISAPVRRFSLEFRSFFSQPHVNLPAYFGTSRLDFGIRLLDFLNSNTLIAAKIAHFHRIDPKFRCWASGLIRATSFNAWSRNRQSAFDTRSAALPLRNRERRSDNASPVINVSKAHSVRG